MLPVDDGGAEGRTMEGVGREPKGRTLGGSSRQLMGVWGFSLEDDDHEDDDEGGLCFPDEWEEGAPLNGGTTCFPFAAGGLLSLIGFSWFMTDDFFARLPLCSGGGNGRGDSTDIAEVQRRERAGVWYSTSQGRHLKST